MIPPQMDQEPNPTNHDTLPDGPMPGKEQDLLDRPQPVSTPPRKGRWLGCLLGGVVVVVIVTGAIILLMRIFNTSPKRMVAIAPPESQGEVDLLPGLNLSLQKGLTPTPTFTASPTPLPTLTPTPTEPPTLTPSPTPIPAFDWTTQVLQYQLKVGAFTSLDIDRDGSLHLVYFQDNNDTIWYAHNDSGDWEYEKVQAEVGHGFHLSMALDSQGRPHFAYHNLKTRRTSAYLWYRFRSDSGWSDMFRERDYHVFNSDISMDLGPDGSPYFIYQSDYDNSLMVAQFDPAVGFASQKVADASPDCQSLPIVVDSRGDPHICFCTRTGLVYAYRQGGQWKFETVDPEEDTGTFSDLFLDNNGNPHVAYYDPDTYLLRYAHRITDGSWKMRVVDRDGDVGRFPSLVVDPAGGVHISYYDASNTALKYAYWNGEHWSIQIVDDAGDVGQYNSLALDPVSGAPRISYYDADRADLKLAWANWR